MFIGREKELSYLDNLYQRSDGQFVILYGRRRVGKTETLMHFCKDKHYIFYSCIECPDQQQLSLFSERILTDHNPASKYINRFNDWNMLFENLAELSANSSEKLVVVIDEFPYMVKENSSIPSILQNTWDHLLKNRNIMLILCGSAMSFIEKEILAEKNPLYGRATGIYKMLEMDYSDAFLFLDGFSTEDKIAAYSIVGGIPYYLLQFDTSKSLKDNIIERILQPGSIMYNDVEFILRQELREPTTYNAIIQAIALGNTKLNDIYQKTQIEKSKLSVYLKNLIDLGIIWREFPVDTKLKEQANISRGLYRITDNYFAFWYSFVFPYRSELESGDANGIWKYTIVPNLDQFVSYSYERICWQYLRKQNIAEKLPFHFVRIGHWWNKKDEIDVLAVDSEGHNFIVGECKYKNSEVGPKELTHLKEKGNFHGQCRYYLFSRNGFSKELYDLQDKNEVTLITLDML